MFWSWVRRLMFVVVLSCLMMLHYDMRHNTINVTIGQQHEAALPTTATAASIRVFGWWSGHVGFHNTMRRFTLGCLADWLPEWMAGWLAGCLVDSAITLACWLSVSCYSNQSESNCCERWKKPNNTFEIFQNRRKQSKKKRRRRRKKEVPSRRECDTAVNH